MRLASALCFMLFAIAAPAAAQSDTQFYIGTWRDIPIDRAPARRVLLHRVEITSVATLRPPRQFSIRVWVLCIDRPTDVCDAGTFGGVERALRDGVGIYVEGNPNVGGALRQCRFNMLLAPAYIPDDPTNPESSKSGIAYRITPPGRACAASEYSRIGETIGTMERVPLLNQPIEPNRPALPRPRF